MEREGCGAAAEEEEEEEEDCEWVQVTTAEGEIEQRLMNIEFFEPAENWVDAFPVGNGRLGAMVFGGVRNELLQLNEDTLWSGGPKDWNNPRASAILPQVRDLVWNARYSEATSLSHQMLGPYCQLYQPLGDLKLDFGQAHHQYKSDSYHRELNLDKATASVTYTVDDVTFTREVFTSHPHQVLVVKVSADRDQCISFSVTLDSLLQSGSVVLDGNRILLTGQAPGDIVDSVSSSFVDEQGLSGLNSVSSFSRGKSSSEKLGMSFAALLEVRIGGENGVVQSASNRELQVSGANWAVLLLAASTSFNGPFNDPTVSCKEPSKATLTALNKIQHLCFDDLYKHHLKDYQLYFHRVALSLSTTKEDFLRQTGRANFEQTKIFLDTSKDESGAQGQEYHSRTLFGEDPTANADGQAKRAPGGNHTNSRVSTKDRVISFKHDKDPRMVTLLFQFGRYLLLSSSRPGTFVANLQGIWNKDLVPAWRCVPHININLPMNYWPAETCNLAECHLPLFDLLSSMATNGSVTASVNYGLKGWVGHHNVDIWAQTAPVGGEPVWALWPMGGAWLSLHLWEHYCFSLDEGFLKRTAYPILKGCAEFFLGWLIKDGKGNLVTNPATSPEHYFVSPTDGKEASVSYATAMDMSIIREVLTSLCSASEILGGFDGDFIHQIKDTLLLLFPQKIGKDNLIMEWAEEFIDPEVNHRHMSHLFGLFPGHSLTIRDSPEFCKAAAGSIKKRGEIGPGWSMAWKNALWARLGDSYHAYRMVVRMFTLVGSTETEERYDGGGLYGNLLNAHPPFQIDGNFGFTAAIAEMLLQTDQTNVYLLPALPAEAWPYGEVSGLRGRGSVTVGMSWARGVLVEVSVQYQKLSRKSTQRTLHYNGITVSIPLGCMHCVYTYDKDLMFQIRPDHCNVSSKGKCNLL